MSLPPPPGLVRVAFHALVSGGEAFHLLARSSETFHELASDGGVAASAPAGLDRLAFLIALRALQLDGDDGAAAARLFLELARGEPPLVDEAGLQAASARLAGVGGCGAAARLRAALAALDDDAAGLVTHGALREALAGAPLSDAAVDEIMDAADPAAGGAVDCAAFVDRVCAAADAAAAALAADAAAAAAAAAASGAGKRRASTAASGQPQ